MSDDTSSQPSSSKQPRLDQFDETTENIDIADVAIRRSTLTDREKYAVFRNHFIPQSNYKFPREHSLHRYLHKYKWLAYSPKENGGYCLPCVLFAMSSDGRQCKGALVETPVTKFQKVYEICDAHADRQYHRNAVSACDCFVEQMSGKQDSIAVQLSASLRETIAKTRQKLRSIIETIVLCGRQNIPLRGHRDSGTDVESDSLAGKNHGNFWALLNFRVSAGDQVLGEHLVIKELVMLHTHHHSNQMISILGKQIQEAILTKVRQSPCFTVIADEVTDSANKEQLAIVLRYCEPGSCLVREDLVSFIDCDDGVTGEALADKILESISIQQKCVVKDTTVLAAWLARPKGLLLGSLLFTLLLCTVTVHLIL